MINIYWKEHKNRPWKLMDNGPFPLTVEEFNDLRKAYIDAMEKNHARDPISYNSVHGCGTVSRDILEEAHPGRFKNFDALIIGQSLACRFVKVESAE